MTTQELHIQIDQLLQKVSSHWNSNFLPQEKDFYINREINKFIKQRMNPLSNIKKQGIFDIMKRVEDLNSLIRTVDLDIVNSNQKEAEYQLPFDFLAYISSEGEVMPRCTSKTLPLKNITTYYQSIKPITIYNTLTDFSINIRDLNFNILHSFEMADLPANYLPSDNLPDYKKLFIVNNAIVNNLINWSDRSVIDDKYIEVKFNNLTQRIEFRSKTDFILEYFINGLSQDVISSSILSTQYTNDVTITADISIKSEEFKTNITNSYLSAPQNKHIVGFLRENKVVLPISKSAVYSTAKLTYIKRPTKVDLFLSMNSELPDVVLDEVIANAVEQIKAVISSDTYEKYTQENMLIE